MITVFFRYDDYSSLSHGVVDTGLIDVFQRRGATCTFAVVPAVTSIYPQVEGEDQAELPLSEEKIAELRTAVARGVVDVAVHGWRHLANQIARHPNPSEFKGLGFEQQAAILRRGRDYLDYAIGVRPDFFVPPWNSYDAITLTALESAGYLGISANRYSPAPPKGSPLVFAPMTSELGGLRGAIQAARESRESDLIVGIMMHPYDFTESGDRRATLSLQQFDRELGWLLSQADVRVVPLSALSSSSYSMDARRFTANRPSVLESAYPSILAKASGDPLYHSVSHALRRKLNRDIVFFGFSVLLALAGGISGYLVDAVLHMLFPFSTVVLPVAVFIVFVLIGIRSIMAGAIYHRGAAILSTLFGAFVGLVI